MDRLLKIIYRLGVAAIWVSALFMAFGVFVVRQGSNDAVTFGFLLFIGIVGLVVQYLWRRILTERRKKD